MELVQNIPFFCIMISMFSGTVSSVLPGKYARRLNTAMVSAMAMSMTHDIILMPIFIILFLL